MTTRIMYNPTPAPDNWIIKKWLETPKGEFIDMGVYGQPYKKVGSVSSEITGVWIDDAPCVEERLLSKLKETLDAPKKQHKPKHKVPFWVQDWRSKK